MSRKDEYVEFLNELDQTPIELEYTLTRAKAKMKANQKHRFFAIPLSSLASFLVVFIIVANSSITFVDACSRIPLLKEFTQLFTFNPSLSAAIENEYVQPMKLKQVQNDIRAQVEYVIVDQKQLNIFYSLDSETYKEMNVRPDIKTLDGKDLEGYGLHTPSPEANGKLSHITVDFDKADVPDGIQLILNISDRGHMKDEEAVKVTDEHIKIEPDYISTFNFVLKFDPYYTGQGEMITLNQEFEIDHQLLQATTIEIYPTHIRLNFIDDQNNTAWLKSLSFHIENEKGDQYEAISNGISATGSPDSPMMASHRLESPFLSKGKKLTLYITGVTWLDKEMEKVKLDLKNKTIESLPESVKIEEIRREDHNWVLDFSAKELDGGGHYQLWDWNYYDPEGNKYSIDGYSSYDGNYYNEKTGEEKETPGRYHVSFILRNYLKDTVYLSPSYSRSVELAKPIKIKIK